MSMAANDIDYSALTVLVVEDEEHTRDILRQLLTLIGVGRIVTAEDGKQGLNETVRWNPDIVFCDIHMKPVDGFTFLRVLRRSSVGDIAKTPVVLLTADALEPTVQQAKEFAADAYVVKPVSLAVMKKRIDALVAH